MSKTVHEKNTKDDVTMIDTGRKENNEDDTLEKN